MKFARAAVKACRRRIAVGGSILSRFQHRLLLRASPSLHQAENALIVELWP